MDVYFLHYGKIHLQRPKVLNGAEWCLTMFKTSFSTSCSHKDPPTTTSTTYTFPFFPFHHHLQHLQNVK